MEICIKVSTKMKTKIEDNLIRVSEGFRRDNKINLGEFINLRGKDGSLVTLQIFPLLLPDAMKDSGSAYVTEDTFSLLEITKTEVTVKDFEFVNNITLGCDPEFYIFDRSEGTILRASVYLSPSRRSIIGCDGDGILAEIRPRPSQDEDVLTKHIYGLLTRAASTVRSKTNKNISLLAGSSIRSKINMSRDRALSQPIYKTAGFHLHFGLPRQILMHYENMDSLRRILIKILDYYTGIPAMIAEGYDHHRRTMTGAYGNPGDFRSKKITLEYRTPGGALLKHPVLTRGLLSLGILVIEDAVSRIKSCTDNFCKPTLMSTDFHMKELYPSIPDESQIRQLICNVDTAPAKNILPLIIADLEEMVGWEKRRNKVGEFLECLLNDTQFINDIEFNWRSYYAKQQRQMDIFQTSF